ncbi:OmpH family outer membrane protein [Nannocystis sp.]|uniref:OmpH family outer membrane protein n=2 Tax=Nannocystis sp. TaxID=1962667 RepID=UPI0025F6CCE9|nr:OmpH family outer membrane protein [Nannocystis sp.]MBK7823981.1 OmpH family outer membrane protein [Nannocystis sp.]
MTTAMPTLLRRLLAVSVLAIGVASFTPARTNASPAAPADRVTSLAPKAAVPKVRGVAVVDMQKVLNDTKQGVAARKKLEDSSKAKQEKLDGKRKKLEADQAKLKNLAGEKLAQAEEALQKDYVEMQQIYMTMQQELAADEGRVLETIYKNCTSVIDKIAAEMEIDLVLIRDETTVLFAEPGLDITDTLVKRYNAKYPS